MMRSKPLVLAGGRSLAQKLERPFVPQLLFVLLLLLHLAGGVFGWPRIKLG